jgi:hypothetical protein
MLISSMDQEKFLPMDWLADYKSARRWNNVLSFELFFEGFVVISFRTFDVFIEFRHHRR